MAGNHVGQGNGRHKFAVHLWQGDSNINPARKHLLWTAILAEDLENFTTVKGIIQMEYLAAGKNSALQETGPWKDSPVHETVTGYVDELLTLSPDAAFRKLLADKANKILTPAGYPESI